MRKIVACLALSVACSLAAACKQSESKPSGRTPDTTDNPGQPGSPDQGTVSNAPPGHAKAPGKTAGEAPPCSAFAESACRELQKCAPHWLEADFADETTCVDRLSQACTHFSDAGKPLDFEACKAALAAPACHAIAASGTLPRVCLLPRGTVGAGGTCGSHSDCRSLSCDLKGACGTCVGKGGVGAPCTAADDCEIDLVCNAGSCQAPAAAGTACDLEARQLPCPASARCIEGTCKPHGLEGETCGFLAACDEGQGFTCAGAACAKLAVVGEGEPCSSSSRCRGGTTCLGGFGDKRCAKEADLGETCGVCRAPLHCVAGHCAFEEADNCSL